MSSEEAGHVSLMEVTPTSGKGTLGAWWSLRQVRARLDKTEHTTATRARGEAMSKLRICVPALEPCDRGEGSEAKGQDFKPDSRNSTVRHYRGASGNVTLVEMGTHLATERVGMVTLHLTVGASELYPNRSRLTGEDSKPPSAAAGKSRGGEQRRQKGREVYRVR